MRLNRPRRAWRGRSPARRAVAPPGRRGLPDRRHRDDVGAEPGEQRGQESRASASSRRPGHGGGRARWCRGSATRGPAAPAAASSSGCRSSGRRTVNAARAAVRRSRFDRPAVQLDQVAAIAAEPRPPVLARNRGFTLLDRSRRAGRTSAAMPIPVSARRAPHALPHGRGERDATAVRRDLMRVGQEVLDHLLEPRASPRTGRRRPHAGRRRRSACRPRRRARSSTTASTMAPTSTRRARRSASPIRSASRRAGR